MTKNSALHIFNHPYITEKETFFLLLHCSCVMVMLSGNVNNRNRNYNLRACKKSRQGALQQLPK